MFTSVTTFVAANVSRSHFRSLVVALSVVACLCQATAAQEPYIGQIYFFYSGEPAQRHNMFSEAGMPVRAKVGRSSTAQAAMSFQLKQSPLTHTYIVLDPETGSAKTHTRPSGQTEIAATNQGSFDWSRHMPTKLAGSGGGQQAVPKVPSTTPAPEICTIDAVPAANAPTTGSAAKVAGSANSAERSRNTVMVMTTNPFMGQSARGTLVPTGLVQSGLRSNTVLGGGGSRAVRSMQIPATNFARPSTAAAQVKRISR